MHDHAQFKSQDTPDLSALKAGDCTAWEMAFELFWPMALRAAQHPKACLVPWEAEDVASDAIIELIEQIESVTTLNHAKALVVMISSRRAIELARKKSAKKRRLPDADTFSLDAQPDFGSNLSDQDRREIILLLRGALDMLEPETRSLLMQKVSLGWTYQELSVEHRLPQGTVCTKFFKALKKIRAQLQEFTAVLKELKKFLR
jgi:RNA polymerase sigma factor (sigma-70 family)